MFLRGLCVSFCCPDLVLEDRQSAFDQLIVTAERDPLKYITAEIILLFGLHRMKGKNKFYWSESFYWTKKGKVPLSLFSFQTKNWQYIFLRIWLLRRSGQSKASQMSANDSSPPSLQKFSPPTYHAAAPQTPSLSSSPQSGLSSRLSNGSFSTQSLTNSRSSMHGVSFLLQIGLTRETVTIETQDLSLSAVKDLVCSIVYQKVWYKTATS